MTTPVCNLTGRMRFRTMQPPDAESPVAKISLAFARALVARDYASAHRMLSQSLRDEMTPSDLKADYDRMTSYWTAPADEVALGYVEDDIDWLLNETGYIGCAYVDIDSHPPNSGACLEAIWVRVVNEAGENRIGEIVWGRP